MLRRERIGKFLVQTPLGARLGLGTQPLYEASGDLQVENLQKAVINIELVRPCWPWNCQIIEMQRKLYLTMGEVSNILAPVTKIKN